MTRNETVKAEAGAIVASPYEVGVGRTMHPDRVNIISSFISCVGEVTINSGKFNVYAIHVEGPSCDYAVNRTLLTYTLPNSSYWYAYSPPFVPFSKLAYDDTGTARVIFLDAQIVFGV